MSRFQPRALGHAIPALVILALVATPAFALDLVRVLDEVATRDPLLAARRLDADAARARARMRGAGDAPMLMLELQNVPASGRLDADPMTMRMVGFEQRLDVSGARALARRAAVREADAVTLDAEALRWRRAAEAWRTYATAYWAGVRARAASEHVGLMARMGGAARSRYESGRGRLDDLLRVEAERARIALDVVMFEAERDQALAMLAALRGLEPSATADSLVAPPEELASSGWEGVASSHPDVRAMDARAASHTQSASAARRMRWPGLTLRASYGFRRGEDIVWSGPVPEPMTMSRDNMWSAGVGLMLPVGSASREGAEATEHEAMAASMRAEARAGELATAAEVAGLRARAVAARRSVVTLADTVLIAQRRALAAAWSAYESGAVDLGAALDAAHSGYAQEVEWTRAHEDLAGLLARLLERTARPALVGLPTDGSAVEGRTR